jgi:nucleoside-diphosphate-sugar epimerase
VFIGEHRSDQVEVLIRSNIEFGSRVLEAMKNVGCRAFVTAGSAWQDFEESGRPANLYAATKNAFAEIVKYYIDAYEMTSIELRIFDSAGPDDTRGKLLSFLAQNLDHAGVSLSPGEQKLHIVHVDDVVEAFRLAAERATSLQAGTRETFYLKSKQAMSLKEILQKFQAKTGERPTVHWGAKPYRFREVMDPYDGGPTLPNWQPKYDLNQILDELLNPNKP